MATVQDSVAIYALLADKLGLLGIAMLVAYHDKDVLSDLRSRLLSNHDDNCYVG